LSDHDALGSQRFGLDGPAKLVPSAILVKLSDGVRVGMNANCHVMINRNGQNRALDTLIQQS
jgi:hypothetical protein